MKRTLSQKLKKSVSAILAAAMSLSLFTAIPVSADIGRTTYNYDGYSVDYNVTNEWDGAQTVELTVSNTGNDSILNWALKYDAEGEISNLWNADLYEQNGDEYVIKNVGWNFEIAPNQSITYGYTLNGSELPLPDNFEIYSKRVDKTDGYDVQYNITKSWDTGVEGNIVITNTSAAPIEAWTLSFDSNFTIDNLWNGRVLENNGTSYTVAAEMWTNPVQPNGSMTIGFVGSKAADVEALLSNFRLTEVVIGEGGIITPDPKLEITANAVYDEENNNVTVSWNTNNPNGTFDVLMSEDGENFVSVGTVEGVSEFVYTPENDFETLYFKVAQTVGEQTAESNIVAVAKSAKDIAISAEASYDKESGKITVSWTSNKENGTFEVFVSEDKENFTSVDTVENVTEFIYFPSNEFDVLYFKVKQTIGKLSAESNVAIVDYPINWADKTDTDNDGLPDVYEKYYFETDPTNPDTDGDGLPDGYEVYYLGTDPTKADTDDNGITDGNEDFDNDGLSNFREYELGTDPNNEDSDSDGLTDGEEINKYKTDPLKVDTDNDKISDYDEVVLNLDPNNSQTDGTSDTDKTFVQTISSNSELLKDINTNDNPYKLSIEIESSGLAENNIYIKESDYTNAINNNAVLGIIPQFTYSYGLNVNDVVINFDITENAVNNTNGKYMNLSDEFVGIKRLNVFKYFEDTNTLLPIETFHDVENNRVYTHVDELGTYCLIDMEVWLDSIGFDAETSEIETYSVNNNNGIQLMSLNDEETQENKYLDIVLVVYPNAGILTSVKKELVNTCNMIFSEAKSKNLDARIYFVFFSGTPITLNDDTLYVSNIDEAKSIIDRHVGITASYNPNSYMLSKAVNCIRDKLVYDFRENSDRYCFVIDAFGFPPCNYTNGGIDTLKENNVKFFFSYSANNENYDKYLMLATDSICDEIKVQKGRYNFGDFIFKQIFEKSEKQYVILSSSGLKPLPKDFGKISKFSDSDYDHDGVIDCDEINLELVEFEDDGTISYPSFDKIAEEYKNLFYVERGLERLKSDKELTSFHNYMRAIKIMPINSDPTDPDGDRDKVVDGVDLRPLKYIPNFEKYDLDRNKIAWYYNIRMDCIPSYDEYGNKITGENRENTVTEYYFYEYIATRDDSRDYHEWAQFVYGLSEREIYLQKSYDQIIEGNGYDGEVTLLGTAGSIIVGFTPFGIVCDIRDLTIDIYQFDRDKGLKQGKDWYLQAVPDFIGILPLAGDIYKGAGDSLSLLSKTDATKIVNEAIESATDSTGKIIKSSDEIVKTISDEAEAIVKEIDYKKTDEIIDVIDDTASEASAKIAKKAVDTSELIGESGRFVDDILETKYQKYVERKIKAGKTFRDRLDWKKQSDYFLGNVKIKRGNDFNLKAQNENWYPYNEVVLSNGKRLDSYDPELKMIVSRKATSLDDITEETFKKYLSELKSKYAIGTEINSPKYGSALKGKVLEGDYYLEIPSSNKDLPNIEYFENLAKEYDVTIIYKDE